MTDLYEFIFKRKSTRKYDMTPLDAATLNKIRSFANDVRRLYPKIKTAFEITGDVKNILPVRAPHYFIISSEKNDGYLENVGFMFQQVDLFLSSMGLGSCWLGMARPTSETKSEPKTELLFVIILAFGKTVDSPHREPSAFTRKPLTEVSSGADNRLEAARLAPSATNSQNWFFACDNGKIDVFQKKLNPAMALMYDKMNKVDMGIALCHLCVATEHNGLKFVFSKEAGKDRKGYIYTGTVK